MGDPGNFASCSVTPSGGVDHDHHNAGSLHSSHRAYHTVPLNLFFYLAFAAKSRSIDKKIYSLPCQVTLVSTASLVVPAMSDTITRSSREAC